MSIRVKYEIECSVCFKEATRFFHHWADTRSTDPDCDKRGLHCERCHREETR